MDVVRQGAVKLRYELYIDVYFFTNFIMDLLLLYLLGAVLRTRRRVSRILAAAAAGAAAACVLLVIRVLLAGALVSGGFWTAAAAAGSRTLEAAGTGALMVQIAFGPESLRERFRQMLLLLFISACMGGLMEVLYEHTPAGYYLSEFLRGKAGSAWPFLTLIFLACGGRFLFRYLWLAASETEREKRAVCRVILRDGERSVEATAYRDSGNCLTEPRCGEPVNIVCRQIWERLAGEDWRERLRPVPYRTVASPWGILEAVRIDAMEIAPERAGGGMLVPHPWIACAPFPVSQDGSYEMLLHREI